MLEGAGQRGETVGHEAGEFCRVYISLLRSVGASHNRLLTDFSTSWIDSNTVEKVLARPFLYLGDFLASLFRFDRNLTTVV